MARFMSQIVGAAMAHVMGYNETFRHENGDTLTVEYTGPKHGKKILKGEFTPRVAVHNVTAYMATREWAVTFFFRGRVLGEGPTVVAAKIQGWPHDADAERYMVGKVNEALAVAAEDPQFGEKHRRLAESLFRDKYQFLRDNRGYREMPSMGAAVKKVYASQVEV